MNEVKEVAATPQEIESLRLLAGDVLFNEGGDRDKLGRGWIWSDELPTCIHQNHVFRARLRTTQIQPEYISLYGNALGPEYFADQGKQTTNLASLSLTKLSKFPIPLPPAAEQRRIVAKLEALLARSRRAKEALDAIPALLERFRQSVLAAAFRGDLTADWRAQHPDVEPASKLLERIRAERRRHWEETEMERMKAKGKVPKDAGWKERYDDPDGIIVGDGLKDLPPTWCWAAAFDVVETGADIVYGIVQPGPEVTDGVPYIRGMDIENGRILEDQLKRTHPDIALKYDRASLRGGDVLLGIIRATKVAIVPPSLNGANITQGTARLRPAAGVHTEFLAAWLACPEAQSRLHAMYRGIDMPGLNLRDVRPEASPQDRFPVADVLPSSWTRE